MKKKELADIRSRENTPEERRQAALWATARVLGVCADPDNPTDAEYEELAELLKELGLLTDDKRIPRDPVTQRAVRDQASGQFRREER